MTLDAIAFERIRKLVYDRAAIVLETGKEYLVESRLTSMARAHGYTDVNALVKCLDSRNPSLADEVVEAMTTNETSFYRDHHPFEAIKRIVLPELVEKRAKSHSLRIWCAACSTGQEPYSLAMLLDQHFPRLASWKVSILATDISKAVLARAASGRYRQVEIDRGLSEAARARYFRQDKQEWEIRPELRKLVQFEELNLAGNWPAMAAFDLVFLRNVLIYFDQTAKLAVLNKMRKQVHADGYLVLGGSETMPAGVTAFQRLPIQRAGLYRPI